MAFRSNFETKVLAAFAAAIVVVCSLSAITWRMVDDAADAAAWVAHTQEVLRSLATIRGDSLQIELSTQSFRISGDTDHLARRDATIAAREKTLDTVRRLTADNADQSARWAQLRDVINARLAIARQVEFLRKTAGTDAANAYVAQAPLQQTAARAYALVGDMAAEENRLLAVRRNEQMRAQRWMLRAGITASMGLVALLVLTFWLIRRQLAQTAAHRRALVESEQSLAATLYSIGDAVLSTDAQGRITRMNTVAEQLTGWSLTDASGQPIESVFQIINEETRAPAEIPVARVLATGAVQGLANHTCIVARDGRETPIADSAAPIRDEEGQVRGVVLVFRDITAQREADRLIQEQNRLLEQRVQERTAQLRDSEAHLRSVTGNAPALIAYVDTQLHYVYANRLYIDCFAPGEADITGRSVRETIGEANYAIAEPLIAKVLRGEPQNYDSQPFPHVWHDVNYVPNLDASGQVIGYYVMSCDVTQRKRNEQKIHVLNEALNKRVFELERVSRALRTLSAGNRTMLRADGEQHLLDSMCQAIVDAGGYQMAFLWYVGDDGSTLKPMAQFGYDGGLEGLRAFKANLGDDAYSQGAVAKAIRSGKPHVVRDIQTAPGYAPWRKLLPGTASGLACPLRVHGSIIGALVVYSTDAEAFSPTEVALLAESADDLAFGINTFRLRAEQEHAQHEILWLSQHDPLTKLPNEAYFVQQLIACIESSRIDGQPFALLQANIQRLSEINDALGFDQGDQMLREFSARLVASAPAPAVVARLRGDEFAVLLRHCTRQQALTTTQRIGAALAKPMALSDLQLDLPTRMGIALFPEHGATAHDLLRHVDMATHQAKRQIAPFAIFDPGLNQQQSKHVALAGELRRAIDAGDMRLYVQPKVEMPSGKVCGVEGLVRWQHAAHGLVPPGDFIALAEQTGLIKPLTEWLIAAALQQIQQWRQQGLNQPLAINLSARNLHDEQLLDNIRHLQRYYELDPSLLELEITETTVMDDAEYALHVLQDIRQEGLPLYIDDFGTGYSSLSYLHKLPVDYIKIDQSFVRRMATDRDSLLIVRSTIDLVHDLGRKTVAEGVETQQHWDLLASMGCDFAQGYFIAKPMPAQDFQGWLSRYVAPSQTSATAAQR